MKKKILLSVIIMFAVCLAGCATSKLNDSSNQTADVAVQTKITATTATTEAPTTTEPPTTTTVFSLPVETIETVLNETADIVNGCILANSGTPAVRAMEQYYYSSDTAEKYAAVLEESYDLLNSNGSVNVYGMIIPTSQAFYTPDVIKSDYADQGECMADTYSKFKNAIPVNIYDILNEHKNEYLYSRTDYHWQPLGAFYASKIFCETADVPLADFDTYEEVVRKDYLGSFYSVNNMSALAEYPDTFTYYKPGNLNNCTFTYYNTDFTGGSVGSLFYENNATSSSYTVFVGTDDTILEVDTDVNNDRVLVIFKDSYGNALVPFLTSSFSKIYLCDFRYFDTNAADFMNSVGATDLLFAMGAPSCNDSSKIETLEQTMTIG